MTTTAFLPAEIRTKPSVNEIPRLAETPKQDIIPPVKPERLEPPTAAELKNNLNTITKAGDIEQELIKAQNQVDETMNRYLDTSMRFSVDESTGKTVISLVDKATGELVRQIPPQEYLEMVSALSKVAQTLLKDIPKFV